MYGLLCVSFFRWFEGGKQMMNAEFRSQSGKSIIELLIVLVVAGILVTMAITRIGNAQSNLKRQNLAKEFKVNLERARFDSVKRRADNPAEMARITLTSATAYTVLTDFNQNGSLNDAEARQVNFYGNVRILGTNLEYPVTIRFDRTGAVTARNASNQPVPLVFTFCEGTCTLSTATVNNSSIISISPSGTVAMLAGGDTIPTFSAPNVSTVNGAAGVNPWVTVVEDEIVPPSPSPTATPVGSTPTPTPASTPILTPTPTPMETPTPTPQSSPGPTPQTTPSSTPTPSVVYCLSGQRPASAGCVCRLPMTVKANGKCQ